MNKIDLHCDTILQMHTLKTELYMNTGHFDLARALPAGIKIQFFALFPGPDENGSALINLAEQMDKYKFELEKNQDYIYPIESAENLNEGLKTGKLGSILHLEGGDVVGNDPDLLNNLYQSGLRSIGLTWNNSNLLAAGIGDVNDSGLTALGREVIKEIESMGIILDAAHLSIKGFFDVLDLYGKPLMVTHANSRTICDHRRNLSDKQLKALAENGGIVGVTQVNEFVKREQPRISDLLAHMVYIADLIGVKHLALGSDFDGADDIVMSGVQDYALWPDLLKARGFAEKEIQMIMHENALRVIRSIIKP
jgi:membrane dipeptidase